MRIQLDDSNGLSISISGALLIAQKQVGGTYTQLGSVPYSVAAQRWWRIRESGGTVYFDFSSDGLIWTLFASVVAPFSLGALTAQLAVGTDVTNASTDTAIFDNLNIPPAFETFSDNFNDNSLDTSKWTDWSGTDVSETGKTLQIQSSTAASVYKGMNSAVQGNLTGSYVHVEVPHVLTGLTGANTLLQVAIDNQHTITLYVGGTTFAAEYQVNGAYTTPATMTYSATAHRWWRIRESGGTIYYEYSADSSSWTVLASVAAPFAVTNLRMSLFIGTTAANASTDTAIFDNLNAFPLLSAANGQYRNDQSTPVPVGGITTDGVTNNVWLETMAYADDPATATTVSAETQVIGTNFTGTATTSQSLVLKQASLPTSRRGSAMVYDAKNKRFIMFGGYDGTSRFNEVWELSADSAYHRWKKLTPSGTAPVARNLCGSVYARGTTSGSVDKAYMVIWGGADPGDRNDMAILDVSTPGSEAWSSVTQTNAPSARDYITHHMAAKVTASNTIDIYLFGGWASSRVSDLNRCTLNVNSPTSVTWTQLKASGAAGNPSIRSGTTMVYDAANNRLIITGGYNNTTYLSDVWQYSISSGSFTQLSPTGTAPAGRELASIGYDSVNQRAIIMGGWQGSAGNNRNDVIQLSLVSGSEAWTQIKSNDTNNQGVLPFSNACAAVDTNRNILVAASLYGYDATDKYVYAFNLSDTSATAPVYSLAVADYFRARDAPAFAHNTTRDELLLINGY
ncbi:MAG TPA: kelch repeat-containing protein, partial [Candidatus Saccharimonadales bacterium]|nr:kelch repeat-containing protein [Candidatus Saccharimonadales bacterium]